MTSPIKLHTILLIFNSLLLFSCTENDKTESVEEVQVEEEAVIIEQYFHVDNLDDYSDGFVEQMRDMTLPSLELKGKMVIVENDTQYFPLHPTIGEYQSYTAMQDTLAIALSIKRLNYTTIEYKLEMVKFGEASYEKEGIVELSPIYFFTGESSQEYKDENVLFNAINDSCDLTLIIDQYKGDIIFDAQIILITDCSKNEIKAIDENNYQPLKRKN